MWKGGATAQAVSSSEICVSAVSSLICMMSACSMSVRRRAYLGPDVLFLVLMCVRCGMQRKPGTCMRRNATCPPQLPGTHALTD